MDQMSPILPTTPAPSHLILDLQSYGMRLNDDRVGARGRKGGAGPTDHKAITIGDRTVMVPVYNDASKASPFEATGPGLDGTAILLRDGAPIAKISYPRQARFYALQTFDGIPYWKIAQLHSHDVLATTVLQNCIRYADRATSCQFCAIGQSLAENRTIAHKTPEQLGEVARAAVLLDNVKHVVLTTGTPNVIDRGAAVLCDSAKGIRAAIDIPIQGQCEPPRDHAWFAKLRDAGIDTLGMHLEAVTPEVRARIMPGKATVSLDRYHAAFEAAVRIFGRGQVSTYILAGLGDTAEAILTACETLVSLGVYPFVVPFVPVSGTPLANHPAPSPEFMRAILPPIGRMIIRANLRSADIKAGCGKCGACSALASYERHEI
jgi:radical SAM protein (TIGR04043 family)